MTAVNSWTGLKASYVRAIKCAKLPYMYIQLWQMIWNKHHPWMVSDKFCPWINPKSEMLKYRMIQVSMYTIYWVINTIQNVSLLRVCNSKLNERRKYWSSITIFTATRQLATSWICSNWFKTMWQATNNVSVCAQGQNFPLHLHECTKLASPNIPIGYRFQWLIFLYQGRLINLLSLLLQHRKKSITPQKLMKDIM